MTRVIPLLEAKYGYTGNFINMIMCVWNSTPVCMVHGTLRENRHSTSVNTRGYPGNETTSTGTVYQPTFLLISVCVCKQGPS